MQKQRQFKERYQSTLSKHYNMSNLGPLSPVTMNLNDLSSHQTLMHAMAHTEKPPHLKGKPIQTQHQNSHRYRQYLNSVTKDIYLPQNLDKVTYQHQHSTSSRVTSFQNNTAKNATKIQLKLSEMERMLVNSKTGVLSFPKTTTNGTAKRLADGGRKGSLPSPHRLFMFNANADIADVEGDLDGRHGGTGPQDGNE